MVNLMGLYFGDRTSTNWCRTSSIGPHVHHDRSHLSHFLCRLIILEISVESVDVVHAARLLDALSPPFSSNCCVSQNLSALSHPSCLLDALQHKRHFAGLCYQDFPIIIYWIDMGMYKNGVYLQMASNCL